MGRRVEKKIYSGTPGSWTLASEQKFVYDGYYQIAEFDGSDTLQKSYVWLGESPGWVKDYTAAGGNPPEGATFFYIVDGNKNVRALVDSSGEVVAEYSYNPFGRITTQTGTMANDNKYRFSSEYHDDETGLVYYNYRYYSPDLQRWLNRDPIEEQGGDNLYAFVNNNPVGNIDALGFFTLKTAAMSKYLAINKIDSLKYYAILLDNAKLQSLVRNFRKYYASLSNRQKFDIWYEFESQDISWVYDLPKCPPKVCKTNGKYVIPCQAGVNPDQWHEPKAATGITRKYHTKDAQVELRSKPVNGHSNQCIYKKSDRKYIFIVSKADDEIPMPGTADFRAPGGLGGEIWDNLTNSGDGHQEHDVIPFDLAKKLGKEAVDKYYKVRPIWSL